MSIIKLLENFWCKVDRRGTDDCWPWRGAATIGGYGQLSNGKRKYNRSQRSLATHIALAIDGRFQPSDDHVAMHACDNPRCVNPAHLSWGTSAENRADMLAKGRSAHQLAAAAEMDARAAQLGMRGPRHKLTSADVLHIRMSPKSGVALAKDMGISHSLISAVRNRSLYDDIP